MVLYYLQKRCITAKLGCVILHYQILARAQSISNNINSNLSKNENIKIIENPINDNEQINNSSEHIQNGQYSESVQLILNILQNLDNIDDQKWILKSTLKSTQKDISFLKNGLSQIMHENQQTKK